MNPTTCLSHSLRRAALRGPSLGQALSPITGPQAVCLLLFALLASTLHAQPVGTETATLGFFGDAGGGTVQGPITGSIDINTLLGTNRFYNAGLTGTRAAMANIEAGYIWNGHEALAHVVNMPTTGGAGEVDRHATWVGLVMGGRKDANNPGDYQEGIAPDAELYTGSIATSWPSSPSFPRYTTSFNVNFFGNSSIGQYRAAFATGLPGGRTADVINSSFNTGALNSRTGTDQLSSVLDGLAAENPRTLMTASVGNTLPSGQGPNRVLSPGTAYNNLGVAALGPASNGYHAPATFSNGGPNDYDDPALSSVVPQARQVVDLAAPGQQIATAYYGGETGGNGPGLSGSPSGPPGGPDWYSRSVAGTSFSAPAVAGGAALLYDAAYALLDSNPDARDARVMKAVLMNSADKTTGWDNRQVAHPNGHGGVRTTQGLDDRVGTGRLNLSRAFDQFLGGTTDVPGMSQGDQGSVAAIGWDYGEVGEEITNDYLIDPNLSAGSKFGGTLTWFKDVGTFGATGSTARSYDNLDLELWSAISGVPSLLISESSSQYNNSEHFSFDIPATGSYMLRIRWSNEVFDQVDAANTEVYGLAWSGVAVPEPGGLLLAVCGLCIVLLGRGDHFGRPARR